MIRSCPTYWATSAFGSSAYKGTFDYGPATHAFDVQYYVGPITAGQNSFSSIQSFAGALAGYMLSADPNENPMNATVNPHWPTFDSNQELFFNTTARDTSSPANPTVVSTAGLSESGASQVNKCDFWRGSISVNAGL